MARNRGRHRDDKGGLERFVGLFESRGWLNRRLRISYRGASYRVFCSRSEFLVYRINENACVPPGVPGWPVCMIRQDQVFHDSEMCRFPNSEPDADGWFRCMAEGGFEALA